MRSNSVIIASLLLLAWPSPPAFAEPDPLMLSITVAGAEEHKGQAILSLFSSPDTYLKEPVRNVSQPVETFGQAHFILQGLKAGQYAISVIYDQDMNNRLNSGLFGIPTEMVGFSNNTRSTFGPPPYVEVSFNLLESDEMTIYLGNAKK